MDHLNPNSDSISNQLKILNNNMNQIIEILKQDQRPIAHWYYDEDGNLKCSNCNREPVTSVVKGDSFNRTTVYAVESIVAERMPYCNKCGAKMEV